MLYCISESFLHSDCLSTLLSCVGLYKFGHQMCITCQYMFKRLKSLLLQTMRNILRLRISFTAPQSTLCISLHAMLVECSIRNTQHTYLRPTLDAIYRMFQMSQWLIHLQSPCILLKSMEET